MNETLTSVVGYMRDHIWLFEIIMTLLITVVVNFILIWILRRVQAKLSSTKLLWGRSIVQAIRRPAAALIWIVGLSVSIDVVHVTFAIDFLAHLPLAQKVAAIATITWFLVKLISNFERNFIEVKTVRNEPYDPTTTDIVSKLLRSTAVIVGALAAMQSIGLSIAGILAFGGVGGIAIGFAARELIANYFGTLMIYLDRPFAVGETITSSGMDIEGTVEEIGWRQTIIRRFDSRTLYVPNSVFTTIAVRNMTRQTNRRIYEFIGIRYDDADQISVIVTDVKSMLEKHPDIDQDNSLMVNFDRFAPSSLDFFIYCFTTTVKWDEYHAVKHDVLVRIMDIIAGHGAEIAFPTSTIHLAKSAVLVNSPDGDSSS